MDKVHTNLGRETWPFVPGVKPLHLTSGSFSRLRTISPDFGKDFRRAIP
jgi:hypothetical protein